MTRRGAIEQAAREARMAAIRACHRCDPSGWALDTDHTPIDPAVRCDHGTPTSLPPPVRDISEPIHERTER